VRTHKRVDFKALRQRVPIEQVCDLLGIRLKKTGDQLRGACAICGHVSDRCFVVTPAKGLYGLAPVWWRGEDFRSRYLM
jgi:hypothetical protein